MDVRKQIEKRRAQCLIHRYAYYVRSTSLVADQQYDALERELKELVSKYPEIAAVAKYADECPTQNVGSSNIWDYPRSIQVLTESLLIYNDENLEWMAKVLAIQEEGNHEEAICTGPDISTGRLF